MKKFFICLCIGLCFENFANGQFSNYSAGSRGGAAYYNSTTAIAVDCYKNVYMAGAFSGSIDADPGPGTNYLVSAGQRDIYLCKLDSSGNLLWAQQFGGTDDDYCSALALDSVSNIYITGFFSASIQFPGAYPITSNGGHDIFITKFDTDGNYLWADQIGGAGKDEANAIAVNKSTGDVFTCGTFYESADFDPDPNTTFDLSGGSNNTYINKIDANGAFVWADGFYSTQGNPTNNNIIFANTLAIDASNPQHLYMGGWFTQSCDFNPDPNAVFTLAATSSGSQNGFIAQYSTETGGMGFASKFGSSSGNGITQVYSTTTDASGNIYSTGRFRGGPVNFNPNQAFDGFDHSYLLTAGGQDAMFICKWDALTHYMVWTKTVGPDQSVPVLGSNQEVLGYSIKVDINQNVYVAGSFSATEDFDPGPGTYNLIEYGPQHFAYMNASQYFEFDAFITRLNPDGDLLWAKQAGGIDDDIAFAMDIDSACNVYTTGEFHQYSDFDAANGGTELISWSANQGALYGEPFVYKTDSNGAYGFAKQLAVPESKITSACIKVLQNNQQLTAGSFHGSADFYPITLNGQNNSTEDAFVAKSFAVSSIVWAKQFTGSGFKKVNAIATDSSGNVYAAGQFNDLVDFDPGPGTFIMNAAGITSTFICKLDPNGNFIWAKQLGGGFYSNDAQGFSITVDRFGNIYTTGIFQGQVDFDPGAGTYNLFSAGGWPNAFISKLDANGNFIWAKQIGGGQYEFAYSIATDYSGAVYTTGRFLGTADFNPGNGVFNMSTTAFSEEIFISKLDSGGNFVWAKQLGRNVNNENGFALAKTVVCAGNTIFIGGTHNGSGDFDPGPLVYTLADNEHFGKGFIEKLDTAGNFIWAKQIENNLSSVSSITTDSYGNSFATGYFYNTADFDPSAATFNLTSSGNKDAFTWGLAANGDFIGALKTGGPQDDEGFAVSCGLSSGLNTVFSAGDFTRYANAFADRQMFSTGAASMYTSSVNYAFSFPLPLHLLSFTGQKQNNSVTLAWQTTNETNTSHFILQRSSDGRIFNNIGKVEAKNTSGNNNYQFTDIHPFSDVNFYRLLMADRDDKKTFSQVLKISMNSEQSGIQVYPNPAKNFISLSNLTAGNNLKIFSADGRLVKQLPVTGSSMLTDISFLSAGLYIIQYSSGTFLQQQKLLKE